MPPRVILLENHGVIILGGTPQAVQAAMMTDKATRIFAGAAAFLINARAKLTR